jgi:hypothetical protein
VVAGRGGSGRKGSGGGDNRVMFCVCVAEQVRITVCLLRFGVNGSFYLNAKKISVCSLVQNCTSLCASSVHICASSVHICACATVLRCTFLCKGCALYMGMEEFVNFILCASELHKNVQRRTLAHFCATRMHNCASFTCTHLVQATYAASDWDLFVVRDRPRAVHVSSLRNEKSHSVSRQASGP